MKHESGRSRELSVVVATDGRSPHLGSVVRAAADDPAVSEVLIVANGSFSDVVRPDGWPAQVRICRLAEGNLSSARNLGLAESRAEVVAFLDDDAVPQRGWGRGFCERFLHSPDAVAAGGPAEIPEDAPLARIHLGKAAGYLGIVEFRESRVCDAWHYPFGCNFALRKAPALQVGGFRTDLGYSSGSLIPHEETEFFHRLFLSTGELWWEAASRVEHRVSEGKRNLRYLIRRAYCHGIGDLRLATIHPDFELARDRLDGARSMRWLVRSGLRLAAGDRQGALDCILHAARFAGRARGKVNIPR